ncbi:MAG: tetratricopeptide repeat protein [Spirochaetaceae bacterium]|nr:tetratricopeptide repeat protein [Spirochaetaceae bacterium]
MRETKPRAGKSPDSPYLLFSKEKAEKALASIVYIQLSGDALASLASMGLNKDIPIPVQLPGPIARFDSSLVSEESIITGILRVLAWQPENRNAAYYRDLVRKLRPDLLADLSDAAISKAQAKEWLVAEEILLALEGLYPEKPEPLLDLALMHEQHAQLYTEEAKEELAEQEDEYAFQCYKTLLGFEPPFIPVYYHAAFFYIRKREFDKAVSLLNSFVKLSDDEEKVGKAKDILKKLQELGYLDTTFKEAYDFIQIGKAEKGLEKALEFVGKYPSIWNGWFLVGWANRKLERWQEGKDAFAKAISLGSSEADTYNEIAICQSELGDLAGAGSNLKKALALDPENVKIIANLGALSYQQGRKDEAAGFFRTALVIDPDDELAKDWLARIEKEA